MCLLTCLQSTYQLIMLWISDFRPEETEAVGCARFSVISHAAVLVFAIALLSIALGLVTYASFQTTLVEQEINGEMISMFQKPEYTEMSLTLEGVAVDYSPADLLLEPVQVAVLVGRSAVQEVPSDIASKADNRLTEATGEDVEVRIGFVEAQHSLRVLL
ncbi:hypothetical protein [Methanosarcina horonobensis]|uniref:hypothetical protein n=1 Tax=Methanosarcina horonobensis TaxID=418008 RepID=UPI0022B8A8DC|nr:hypothetical protein [Methanosarcina horonobensis]